MSLWGEEFEIKKEPERVKKAAKKISEPKDPKVIVDRVINSRSVSILEKLTVIREEVRRILGKFVDDTILIRSEDDLKDYIDCSINNGFIAIDTETSNSLDPITCKLMGACIYTPGRKNAYIPVNHVHPETLQLLDNQLTESQIKDQFSRLSNTKIIMHNGKFDYEVIKCTCDIPLKIYWDTEIAARILNENELAALKKQYVMHIDPDQEKYSIEYLFSGVEYSLVDPETFALYAATDSYITYRLYEWQKEQFNLPGNERIYNLFLNIEMPIVEVAAEMELLGVEIDKEYAERLSKKYHLQVDEVDQKISVELDKYLDKIKDWRSTSDANYHPTSKKPDKNGNFKLQKSKSEQLADPPQVTSPTQLAILLYDVFKTPVIDRKAPRGTGEDIITKINLPICKLILEKRGLEKLIGTYIDKLPACVCSVDNRLHANFKQLGADTGRFSSSDPNLQNIPSHMKNIRLMFRAGKHSEHIQVEDGVVSLCLNDEIQLTSGVWKVVKDLVVGEQLYNDIGNIEVINNIRMLGNTVNLTLNQIGKM